MQTWSGVRLGLLAHGYRLIHYHQFNCDEHGTFRAGIEAEECKAYRCPVCQRKCRTVFLAAGYTRRETPLLEQIVKPFSHRWKMEFRTKEHEVYYPVPYSLRF